MYKFLEELPIVNLTDDILILKKAQDTIKKDWFDFCNHFICNELKFSSSFKNIPEIKYYEEKSNKFISFSNKLKNIFGFGEGLGILDFEFNSGIYSVILTTNYEKMVKQYNDPKLIKINGKTFTPRSILSRFFIFQRNNKKLLFPITTKTLSTLKYDFRISFDKNDFHNRILELISSSNEDKYIQSEIKAFNGIISSCIWDNIKDITNEDINQFQTYCFNNKEKITSYVRKISVLNKIRLYLINNGVMVDAPTTFTNSIRINPQSIVYDMKKDPFEWLSIESSHKLFYLKNDANLYLRRLYSDGVTTSTCKKYMVALNHMFRYILKEQESHEVFNENSVNSMFDINNENTFIKYLQAHNKSDENLDGVIGIINKFLEFSGLMTQFAKKNIPRRKRKKRTITPRNAMPQVMLNELKNILMNNPPKSNTIWEPSKANLSWWKFKDVYPVQPIMMLIHLNIPIRGGQLRHLCRRKSLVFNQEGNLEKFIINTDKNVNRDSLQEIPNVWDELNILKDYLAWQKEYFPYLPMYKYNNEDNTPWEDIEPLFLIPNSLLPITPFQHKVYLTKLLCTYQIKINQLYNLGEISYLINVAWKKSGEKFFQSIDELNQSNDTYLMNQIQVAYDIHAIRVTGITRYLHAGVNLNVLLMLTGHVDFNMIVNVYTKFTKEEKKEILKSAINKLRFDQPENLVDNVENFIFNEIPSNYNIKDPKDIKRAFKENGLFSMNRKASSLQESLEMDKGVDLATIKHPTTWFPMISGICPGVQCPEGRERKCSICGYFITGKLFLNGVIHMANMAMASFVRLSKEHEDENNKSKRYSDTKSSKLELLVEEIMGWHEIIDKIEVSIKDENINDLPIKNIQQKSIELEEIPIELAYLESCYNAKLMGVEQDGYGLKILTIKAIQYANITKDNNSLSKIISSEENAIDYLMSHYLEHKEKRLLSSFIKKIR